MKVVDQATGQEIPGAAEKEKSERGEGGERPRRERPPREAAG
jgi:hypothetical protein